MTNERAIELLNRISDSQFDGVHGDERREALEMAVRALFSQQIVNDSQGLVNDCISRKMAIDAFEPEHDTDWYTPQIIEVLEELPPVQPTQTNADSTQSNTLDCVSRQQAIDYFVTNVGFHDEDGYPIEDTDELRKIWTEYFSGIPFAQPKRGRWIKLDMHRGMADHKCSVCEQECYVPTCMGEQMYTYCPNCGARMEGESDE